MPPTLRPATPADQPFLESLFFAAHAHEFASLHLPEPQLTALLRMQATAQRTGYATTHPHAQDSIILNSAGAPIGRILVDRGPARIDLVDIVLTPAARGQGIGTALIEDLKSEGRPIRLQVRPENPAFRLYSRLGFRLIGAGMQLELEHSPDDAQLPATLAQPEQPTPWDAAIGTTFDILTDLPGAAPQLLLARIERHPAYGPNSFSLYFDGPLDPQLSQGTYPLQPTAATQAPGTRVPEAQEPAWIFLVPTGPRGRSMEYEAVFNL